MKKKTVRKPKASAKLSSASKLSYADMIKAAVVALKDRSGSSRQAIKKFIHANYKALGTNSDAQINSAIKRGVTTGFFMQPKGPK